MCFGCNCALLEIYVILSRIYAVKWKYTNREEDKRAE